MLLLALLRSFPASPSVMSKTLVLQPLPGIGDMIWHLPHVAAIAAQAPTGTVSLAAKRSSHADQILGAAAHVADIIWLEPSHTHGPFGFWHLARHLRPHGFDEAWILHGSPRYAAAAAAVAGIPLRRGFGLGWQRQWLTHHAGLTAADRSMLSDRKAAQLITRHGGVLDPTPRFQPAADERAWAARETEVMGGPHVILGIGASQKFKQWGLANFAAMIAVLQQRHGARVHLLAGGAEKTMAENLAAGAPRPDHARVHLNQSMGRCAALALAGDLFIGNDSGMLNLAAAAGARAIGLFGGSPPLDIFPGLIAVTPPDGQITYQVDRMDDITVAQVLATIEAAWEQPLTQPPR